jgi:O-antigen ligase
MTKTVAISCSDFRSGFFNDPNLAYHLRTLRKLPLFRLIMKNSYLFRCCALMFPCLLVLFPGTALSTPVGAGLTEAALLLVATAGFLHFRQIWITPGHLSKSLRLFCVLWLVSVALELLLMTIHGFSARGMHSPLLRIAALISLVLMVEIAPRTSVFWYGIALGCFTVFVVACYQKFHLKIDRATGFHNPIHFGNFSLAMSMMALAALTQLRSASTALKLVLGLATLAGVLTSFLSGSRGGWLALLLIFIPLMSISKDKKQMGLIALFFGAGLVLVYAVPETGVRSRIEAITHDLIAYDQGNIETSVGMRLELFRSSFNVFLAHPLIGVGDNFKLALDEMARLGKPAAAGHDLNDTHNEAIYALMRGGVFGFGQLLLLYLAPLIYFGRALRRPENQNNQALLASAAAGFVLVLVTIDFGLTVNVFTRHIGKALYFILICFLVAMCEIEMNKAKKA